VAVTKALLDEAGRELLEFLLGCRLGSKSTCLGLGNGLFKVFSKLFTDKFVSLLYALSIRHKFFLNLFCCFLDFRIKVLGVKSLNFSHGFVDFLLN